MKQNIYIVRVPGDREYYTSYPPKHDPSSGEIIITSPLKRSNNGDYTRIKHVDKARIMHPTNVVVIEVSAEASTTPQPITQQGSVPTRQPPMVADPSSHFRQQAVAGVGPVPPAAEGEGC